MSQLARRHPGEVSSQRSRFQRVSKAVGVVIGLLSTMTADQRVAWSFRRRQPTPLLPGQSKRLAADGTQEFHKEESCRPTWRRRDTYPSSVGSPKARFGRTGAETAFVWIARHLPCELTSHPEGDWNDIGTRSSRSRPLPDPSGGATAYDRSDSGRDHCRYHAGRNCRPGGDGLHKDRRHAFDHGPLHDAHPHGVVRLVRLLTAPGGGRRFGDGGDPCRRHGGNRRHRFRPIHGVGRLACVDGRGFLNSGAPHATGISGGLPLAHCVDRFPDWGRRSGRAGGDRRYVGSEERRPWHPGEVVEQPSTTRAGQQLRTDGRASAFW